MVVHTTKKIFGFHHRDIPSYSLPLSARAITPPKTVYDVNCVCFSLESLPPLWNEHSESFGVHVLFTRLKRDFSTVSHASDDERTKEKREEKFVSVQSRRVSSPHFSLVGAMCWWWVMCDRVTLVLGEIMKYIINLMWTLFLQDVYILKNHTTVNFSCIFKIIKVSFSIQTIRIFSFTHTLHLQHIEIPSLCCLWAQYMNRNFSRQPLTNFQTVELSIRSSVHVSRSWWKNSLEETFSFLN